MKVRAPTKKAELNRSNNDGKGKYKSYLKQTKATKLKNRLDIRDEGGGEQFWRLTEQKKKSDPALERKDRLGKQNRVGERKNMTSSVWDMLIWK